MTDAAATCLKTGARISDVTGRHTDGLTSQVPKNGNDSMHSSSTTMMMNCGKPIRLNCRVMNDHISSSNTFERILLLLCRFRNITLGTAHT
jgi:hypothetical protein